jgi:hypothetical protein
MENRRDEAILTILTILDFMEKFPKASGPTSENIYTSFIQEVEQAYGQWEGRLAEHRANSAKVTYR